MKTSDISRVVGTRIEGYLETSTAKSPVIAETMIRILEHNFDLMNDPNEVDEGYKITVLIEKL